MGNSSNSSLCSECRMEVTLLLQRRHSGLVPSHHRIQLKQKRWRHGMVQAVLSQVPRHIGQRSSEAVAMLSAAVGWGELVGMDDNSSPPLQRQVSR